VELIYINCQLLGRPNLLRVLANQTYLGVTTEILGWGDINSCRLESMVPSIQSDVICFRALSFYILYLEVPNRPVSSCAVSKYSTALDQKSFYVLLNAGRTAHNFSLLTALLITVPYTVEKRTRRYGCTKYILFLSTRVKTTVIL
jgi:hypothetical protein